MKTIVITGCTRGIGKGLMERYASEGYDVIALIRKESETFTEEAKRISETYHVTITPVYTEMENESSLKKALAVIEKMECSVDILINNAAVNISKPAFYMEYEDVERSFKVNYFAPFLISKEIGAMMMRQGWGNIVNITSVAGLTPEPGGAAYDASKAALNAFTKSFAQELAPFGVRVNAVACSVVETDMFAGLKTDVQRKILKRIAMKRPSTIEEVANTILFITSVQASYITGQIICVDGGYAI